MTPLRMLKNVWTSCGFAVNGRLHALNNCNQCLSEWSSQKIYSNLPSKIGIANTFGLCENENLLSCVRFEHFSSAHNDKFCFKWHLLFCQQTTFHTCNWNEEQSREKEQEPAKHLSTEFSIECRWCCCTEAFRFNGNKIYLGKGDSNFSIFNSFHFQKKGMRFLVRLKRMVMGYVANSFSRFKQNPNVGHLSSEDDLQSPTHNSNVF